MYKFIAEIKRLITERTTTKTTVVTNTIWLFSAEIGSRIARGVLAIVAARMLGASGLGEFSYALALGGFLTFFEEAGIALFVTREFAKHAENKNNVFGTAIILKTFLLILAIATFILWGPLISSIPQANTLFPIIALLLIFDSLREFLFSITRAEQNMQIESKIKMITNVLIFIFGITFIVLSPTALSLAEGYMLGSAVGCVIILMHVKSNIPHLIHSFSKKIFVQIFKASLPFTILAASNVVIFNTDTLFLGHYSNVTDVGLYSAANRLIQIFYILPSLFATVTFPVFIQKIIEKGDFNSALRKSLLTMIGVMIPLILAMSIGSHFIITTLFGSEYAAASKIVVILSLSYIPVFIGSVLNNAVFARDHQNKFIAANVIGILLNAFLNILLVPRLFGVGAAIATVLSLSTITMLTAKKMHSLKKGLSING